MSDTSDQPAEKEANKDADPGPQVPPEPTGELKVNSFDKQVPPEPTGELKVNSFDKQVLLFALDTATRKVGEDISKLGITSVQDGGQKLFALRDMAVRVDLLQLSVIKA